MKQDVRWQQRFDNFSSALENLKQAVDLSLTRPLTDLEKQGLIQAFEFTHELAWNVMKDFLSELGVGPLYGSKDTTREAFQKGLIQEGDVWMEMIKSRNLTSHTYRKAIAEEISDKIRKQYFVAFVHFHGFMKTKLNP